jgi:tetratricopeptide (TPR) repeat protein
MIQRKFDFSLDYEVRNELGTVLFDLARQQRGDAGRSERERLLRESIREFETTLESDSENVTAHYNLSLLYAEIGDQEESAEHRRQHARLKPDDNAADRAVQLAREKYPAANHAAEAVVIYPLQRAGAPELPTAGNDAASASSIERTLDEN